MQMKVIREKFFPFLLEKILSSDETMDLRSELVERAHGDVLEIGMGTGLNIELYSEAVTSLTILDPNRGMFDKSRQRIAKAPMPIRELVGSAENVEADNNTFDTVVSTWTLCSVPDGAAAMKEIYRVLKPGGIFLYIEHGKSKDAGVYRWQKRLNPIQKRIAFGCTLDTDMNALIQGEPFTIEEEKEFYQEKSPKTHGYQYQGVARK